MTRSRHGSTRVGVAAGALLLTSGTAWGQTFVYPQKGQTPQQQTQNQAECQAWATHQTGVNPGMPAPGPAPVVEDDGSFALFGACTLP
jgi:hypothetical protein